MNWLVSWRGLMDIAWLLFLLLLLRHFWQDRRALEKARHWLITRGRITKFLWTREGTHLWPKIEYTYHIYDQDFTGEYFFLDTSHNNPNSNYSRQVAYRAAIAFEKDEEIDVYYNPNNPVQAALDVRIPVKLNVIIVLLLALIAVHLGMMGYHLLVK
ncbi:MAG: DUF3592 domain-containing protein [Legionella sp.]|nr:DUF3592 domain-containing protein [Legionella sp.]